MANKKIFTGYTFEGGGQSKNLRLEAATSDPTNVGKGHAYYNTTAGTIKVSNADADATDSWKTLLTTGSSIAASQVDLSNVSATGLLNTSGSAARAYSEDKTGDTIVSRDGLGRIKVGTPASGDSDDYAASKGYVDSVAQGLDHKASVKFTTTGNISLSGTSAGNVDDTNSNAHAAGDRILVKDQDTASQNGIYIAASGNWTRATDADGSDLTEGAFVFVEDGTVNPNTSWVMTADNTWAQFSGAGQITVTSTKGSSSSTGPLIKTGDTIDFGFNATSFDVDSDSNLRIAEGGVVASRLANDAVTPDKLQDTGSFLMGRLGIGAGNSSGGALGIQHGAANQVNITHDGASTNEWGLLLGHGNGTAVGSYHGLDNAAVINVVNAPLHLGTNNAAIMTLASGKVIVGRTDTPSSVTPSGTLHVSTARYGSELASGNWTNSASSSLDFASISGASSTGFTGVWENGASNRAYIAVSGGFVVGKTYRIKFDYVIGSGSNVDLYQSDSTNAGQTHKIADLDGTTYDANYTPSNATDYIAITGTGGSGGVNFVLSNFSIKEDTLSNNANQTLSVNSAADDLVIANNDHGGLSIITPADKKGTIFFGDKADNDVGTIKYDHSNNSLAFGTDGDGLCLTLASDHSAKFENFVGINGTLATDPLSVKGHSANDYVARFYRSDNANTLVDVFQDSSNHGHLFVRNSGGSTKVKLFSAGVSYFRGGNLEIDTRTDSNNASAELTVKSDVHASVVADRNADTNSANFMLRTAGYNKWRMSLGMAGSGNETFSIYDEANTANVLEIAQGGTQDHKANSIVNSASIAGLQDSACYYIGAIGDAIDTGYGNGLQGENRSYSIWVKLDDALSNDQMVFASDNGTNQRLYVGVQSDKWVFGLASSAWNSGATGAVTAVNGKWTHVVVTVGTQYGKLYVDGVLTIESNFGSGNVDFNLASNIFLGKQGTGSSYGAYGSYRDFKVISSELDAGDIRKLYSGENPKKNLNVNLVTNGDFSSALGTTWVARRSAVVSIVNEQLKVLNAGGVGSGIAEQAITLTGGKTYKLKADVKSFSGLTQAYMRVWTTSATSGGSADLDKVVTAGDDQEFVFTVSGSGSVTRYVTLQGYGGSNDNYVVFDNVSLTEIGTLVEFTSNSASTSKWYNDALLGFYDGTVNNATLSQGNTYWNNIKQDGETVSIGNPVNPSAKLHINEDSTDTPLQITRASTGGNGMIKFETGTTDDWIVGLRNSPANSDFRFYSYGAGADALTIARSDGDVKIASKLGIGDVADANHNLRIHNTANYGIYFTGTNGTIASSNNIILDPATMVYLRPTSGNNVTIDTGDGLRVTSGNVAIGGTAAFAKLEVITASNTDGIQIRRNNAEANSTAMLGFRTSTGGHAGNTSSISAVRSNLPNVGDNKLVFQTRSSGALAEHLTIDGYGIHDHKANRIVNSQTVNDSWRSSEPSLRFDNTATNNRVDLPLGVTKFNKGDFTIVQWLKTEKHPSATNANYSFFSSGSSSEARFYIYQQNANTDTPDVTFRLNNSSNAMAAQVVATDKWTHGEWHQLVCVGDRSAGMSLYIDGVLQASNTTDTSSHDITEDSGTPAKIGNQSSGYQYGGEIKATSIHNRAMEADEVKGLYNGEATPWLYADAGAELIHNGDFATNDSWTLHQGTNATTSFGSGVLTISNSSSSTAFTGADQSITVVKDKIYRLKLDVTVNNGAIYVKDNSSNATLFSTTEALSSGQETPTISSTVTGKVYYFKALASGTFTLRISRSTANGNTISVNVDNVSIQQIGEIAAYTPQSIGGKPNGANLSGYIQGRWADTTSNGNHGDITGATVVNPNVFGAIEIRGSSATNSQGNALTIRGGLTGNDRLDLYHDLTTAYINADSSAGGGYNLQVRGKSQLFKTYVSGWQTRLEIETGNANGAAVKATSATSTNLKQVARTTTDTIEGDGTAVAFEVNHQLGTKFVTVSVREKDNGGGQSFAYVDTEIRGGAWADPNGAVETIQANSEESHITVIFATAPASGKDYYVTCVGA